MRWWFGMKFSWLGVVIIVPPNLFTLFDGLSVVAKNKKMRKDFRLI
jgi:hypothetical protein